MLFHALKIIRKVFKSVVNLTGSQCYHWGNMASTFRTSYNSSCSILNKLETRDWMLTEAGIERVVIELKAWKQNCTTMFTCVFKVRSNPKRFQSLDYVNTSSLELPEYGFPRFAFSELTLWHPTYRDRYDNSRVQVNLIEVFLLRLLTEAQTEQTCRPVDL